MEPIETTETELVAVFTEWDRRYREDPRAFQSDVERFLTGQTIEEYGQAATQTLLMFLEETRKEKK